MDVLECANKCSDNFNRIEAQLRILTILTLTALLEFDTPRGLRFHLSSLPSPNFASSYTFGTAGTVDGSVSYLYSSLPLQRRVKSANVTLEEVTRGYRQLHELLPPDDASWSEIWHRGKRIDRKGRKNMG